MSSETSEKMLYNYRRKSKMRRNLLRILKLVFLFAVAAIITIFLYKSFHLVLDLDDLENHDAYRPLHKLNFRQRFMGGGVGGKDGKVDEYHPKQGSFFMGSQKNANGEVMDWHDYHFMELEQKRRGLGEIGLPAHLPAEDESERLAVFNQNGFNGLLSDRISLNRSVADIRHKDCANLKYLKELPTVSVVVPFFDEHWSTLLRTCYSVLNRSPAELIVEIILVDDHSTKTFLKGKLDQYVAEHLPKVKIVRLPERSGLIVARMAGARVASGDVLIFLDSHTETNVNWLPPLLDPIARNYKVCMCPFIDVIAYDTFEYRAQDEGARGAFDWQFYYKRLPLLEDDLKHPVRPFKSPVMAGGLFAISAKFFWELGGYDSGLDIWGGEQYELSFKIWQCGGEMYDAPCSRIGHIYRGSVPFANPRKTDYLHKNYKRVAEVWMDEYAEYLYKRSPKLYGRIDAGDLTEQRAIREKLQCKPFKWFMEEIAFDLPLKYPPIEPPDFASGTLQNVANPIYCADTLGHGTMQPVGVFSCSEDHIEPQSNQYFHLSWHKDIRIKGKTHCWDVPVGGENAEVIIYDCHGQQGNQGWRYDFKNKQILHGGNNRCLDLDVAKRKLMVNDCDENNKNQHWVFGVANETALAHWSEIGPKIF